MRIAFITSCAAPGQDGVGDYTRLLADSCQRQGHTAEIIALHDRLLKEPAETTHEPVPILRLAANRPWSERLLQAQTRLETFAPDWTSLQFVPYGFHRKGLSRRLPKRLKGLTGRYARQLMLHELWIGAERDASIKHRLIGCVQRWLLLDLIHRVSPRCIHTSNSTYQALLRRHRIPSTALPMFGAFPAAPANTELFLSSLRDAGAVVDVQSRPHLWIFGMLGTLHPIWPAEPLLAHLQRAGIRHQKRILIAGIGRLGPGQTLWQELVARYGRSIEFCHLGEQPPERISMFLNGVDFGIAATPLALIGKSATTAAMLEHGLPVIVNRDDVRFAGCPAPSPDSSLIMMTDALPEQLAEVGRGRAHPRLPDVTCQFLRSLEEEAA